MTDGWNGLKEVKSFQTWACWELQLSKQLVASVRGHCYDITYATIRCVVFLNLIFEVWYFSISLKLTGLGQSDGYDNTHRLILEQLCDKRRLSWLENLSFKLTNIIFEIDGTILTGSKNNLSLSIDHWRSRGPGTEGRDLGTPYSRGEAEQQAEITLVLVREWISVWLSAAFEHWGRGWRWRVMQSWPAVCWTGRCQTLAVSLC